MSTGAGERLSAAAVLEEASQTLVRLQRVRGASATTRRRMARAAAVMLAAAGLVAGASLAPAHAATPNFLSPFPFGLGNVGAFSSPSFADLDGDGDLDAFIGSLAGNTIYFANTGSSAAPAFAASSANPFGLAGVGGGASSPSFADLDGDGDLDAFIGNGDGDTIYFANTGSSAAPAFAASSANPFGLADVGAFSSPTFADLDGDGDLDAFIGNLAGNTIYFANTGSSAAPAFAASSTNPFGLAAVGFRSSPAFADPDGDGDLDAFIGEREGNTFYFENTGSSAAPAFAASAANPFGLAAVGTFSSPSFADLDGDGDLDAFIGERNGNTIYFANTGSSAAPAFAASAANPFGLADVGYNSSPSFADLDGDGDLDAFIGEGYGNTIYFANTGSSAAPAFAASSANPFGLADVGSRSSPAFADLDGDGDLDAFVGEVNGNTIYFANTGSSAAPAFAAASANPFGLADVGYDSSPTFADLDGDGDLDAFIGDREGNTFYFENSGCGNGGVDAGEECDDGNTNNADGCNTLCQTPGGDADADGVTNAVENAGPNGGDANGDGMPDSTQPNVGSLPGATDGTYQTLVTDAACPIENLAAQALNPAGWSLPFGALSFELPGCESTRVTIYYHGRDSLASPPFQYVKQGPNPPGAANDVTYTLSAGAPHMLVMGSANLGFDPAVAFAAFTLSDNVVGDDTGNDHRIVDQGGPGLKVTPAAVPVLGWSGLSAAVLGLLGLARRRLR